MGWTWSKVERVVWDRNRGVNEAGAWNASAMTASRFWFYGVVRLACEMGWTQSWSSKSLHSPLPIHPKQLGHRSSKPLLGQLAEMALTEAGMGQGICAEPAALALVSSPKNRQGPSGSRQSCLRRLLHQGHRWPLSVDHRWPFLNHCEQTLPTWEKLPLATCLRISRFMQEERYPTIPLLGARKTVERHHVFQRSDYTSENLFGMTTSTARRGHRGEPPPVRAPLPQELEAQAARRRTKRREFCSASRCVASTGVLLLSDSTSVHPKSGHSGGWELEQLAAFVEYPSENVPQHRGAETHVDDQKVVSSSSTTTTTTTRSFNIVYEGYLRNSIP
ncbi:hypothetical protein BKA70DRAFT_1401112 [Coprinopsis sp. MPI-PUGE-AT-0042]|nr:hypothetical protein BKA70DRAFT_1401112 [Coprinopsis sp. MPI-PUGE-AT-0042]